MDRTGQTFTLNGLSLKIVGSWGGEWEIHSTRGPGVWFASEAQVAAALGA